MGFVPLGQHHGNAQGDVAGFTGLQLHCFGGAQVDPVALTVNIAELFDLIAEIADADLGHGNTSFLLNEIYFRLR